MVSLGDIDVATKKVAEVLGLELVEVEDWNCCGGGFLDEKDEVAFVSINPQEPLDCGEDGDEEDGNPL